MNISEAIEAMESGKSVCRETWTTNGAHLKLKDDSVIWSSNDHPAQYYTPIMADIMAKDWKILDA